MEVENGCPVVAPMELIQDLRKHFNEHIVGNNKNPKQYTIGILHCSKAGATYKMKTN